MVFWVVFNILGSYWITYDWVDLAIPTRKKHSEYYYILIYFCIAIIFAFIEMTRCFLMDTNNQRGMKRIFEKMTKDLLNAPINEFFERVPIGRILNRYSEDLSIVDFLLPVRLGFLMVIILMLFGVLSILI